MTPPLTRRQQEVFDFLVRHESDFPHPPTLEQLARAMGLTSRGSLHKHIQALIDAGLVEPMDRLQRGVRLAGPSDDRCVPLLGKIAAGRPIEAVADAERIEVPDFLRGSGDCYVLRVRGESMVDDGILDGDLVVVESRTHARNGEIVVALIDGEAATLKRIEQASGRVILHPANSAVPPLAYPPERVAIQGVVRGVMRRCS